MLPITLAAIGALALALGLASRPLRTLPVTEPMLALGSASSWARV